MAERQIIFSAPMVLALLAGRKTQTRRLLKPPRGHENYLCRPDVLADKSEIWWQNPEYDRVGASDSLRYQTGDRLWVRETHQINASGYDPNWTAEHVIYPADDACVALVPPVPYVGRCDIGFRWRPSIHMPRWASRITLIVEAVKVEPLQDISGDDAQAEGIEIHGPDVAVYRDNADRLPEARRRWDAFRVRQFRQIWSGIHGDNAWDANPHVIAVTFRVERANIDNLTVTP